MPAKKKKLKTLTVQPVFKKGEPPKRKGERDIVVPRRKIKPAPAPSLVLSPDEKRKQKALEKIAKEQEVLEEASRLCNFPKNFLGLETYQWQRNVLEALEVQRVSVITLFKTKLHTSCGGLNTLVLVSRT